MFENIKSNFRSRDEISKIQFTVVRNSQKLEDDPPPGNIRFERYGWIYPNTPAEMQLFNWLFDPPSLRQAVYDAYREIFDRPTVGFTIRRGDFRRLRHSHRFMNDSEAAETAHTL